MNFIFITRFHIVLLGQTKDPVLFDASCDNLVCRDNTSRRKYMTMITVIL